MVWSFSMEKAPGLEVRWRDDRDDYGVCVARKKVSRSGETHGKARSSCRRIGGWNMAHGIWNPLRRLGWLSCLLLRRGLVCGGAW